MAVPVYRVCWRITLQWIIVLFVIMAKSFMSEAKTVSQCGRVTTTFRFVSLYCGFKKVIQIQRAFHGAHKNAYIDHCSYLSGDCTMDTTHLYDWSNCEGKHSCVLVIKPRDMDTCRDQDMVYLQVHYACVPGTAYIPPAPPPTTTPVLPPNINMNNGDDVPNFIAPIPKDITDYTPKESTSLQIETTTGQKDSGHSICMNKTWTATKASIRSPGFPEFYPSDTECRCVIKGRDDSKVAVTYHDLSLIMRGGQCVDWLLLQSLGYKNSAAVTCGQMLGKEKTLMAKGNWLLMHFHSAKGGPNDVDNDVRNMHGFKVKVKTEPEGPFDIQCYPTPPEVLQTLKYKDSQLDINNNTLVPRFDLETLGQSSGSSSTLSALPTLTLVIASIYVCMTSIII